MSKKEKASKKEEVSQAKKMCFYMGGYGNSDRGLAHFGGFDECGHYHDVCCC